ncbi:MAG: DUF2442 domain-containing protein [Selenomonadaceae bacterium]|nr:DUF2442 domain-containing protein [Selenomonadaceae bacterium]
MIRPTAVSPLPDYKLLLTFSTGEKKIFDVTPYLSMPFFASLNDKAIFQRVFVNEYTVEWANGRDIAPHELYDNSIPLSMFDSDFTKLTPAERARLDESERDWQDGRTVKASEIDWN